MAIAVTIVSTALTSFAQIPNAGFETWMNMGTYQNPDSWSTLNDFTTAASVYTAEPGTPGSPGSSYLKLTSKSVGGTVANGIAVSGTLDPVTHLPKSGFAFSGQPVSLTGKWQHMIYGTSQGSINVQLTRWDAATNARITVATANKTLTGMAMSWASFTIPLVYTDAQAPDSCIIILRASGTMPTDQDYLWVDNLAFSGSVAGLSDQGIFAGLEIFPNPATDKFQVNINSTTSQKAMIELVNESGAVLLQKSENLTNGVNNISLNVTQIAKGNYFLKIHMGTGQAVYPVVIE